MTVARTYCPSGVQMASVGWPLVLKVWASRICADANAEPATRLRGAGSAWSNHIVRRLLCQRWSYKLFDGELAVCLHLWLRKLRIATEFNTPAHFPPLTPW